MSRALKPCGTPAAYRRHQRHGERPCDACREADNARRRVPGGVPFRPAPHGSASKYRAGCRCEECVAANRSSAARFRARAAQIPRDAVPHGAGGYSNYGCRCQTCTEANSQRSRRYRQRRKAAA